MQNPIVSRGQWNTARAELLEKEKKHTHAGDALAAAWRRLPMTPMEPVTVVGPKGPIALQEVFESRKILLVYHFMWKLGTPHHKQCEGCTFSQVAMNDAVRSYLGERDVTYAVFCSGRSKSSSRNEISWAGPRRGTRLLTLTKH
ncbi:DUF899 family protein [Aureliella helgolandensis]|uniref:DUF899 domain-containing protein n=1 Tax=Aureliella helgolandensis TaxID=2527968 RepID=A0A518GCR9_9BACT|nr:DUF899 family protein [Aureliella helgolandensis]QDV26378.1 hypothetical protein Q31a_47520 [Aureliella helgolandensis]